jgi:hypothetical protein
VRAKALAVGVLCAAAPLVVGATAALAAGPTGNPTTIAYVRAIDANTNIQRGMQISQTGYMTLASHGGAKPSFSYQWGFGTVPAGSVPAKETITYAQHDGRVVWIADLVQEDVADCSASATCKDVVPIELLITTHAAFAGVVAGPGAAVACFDRESFNDVPYRAGAPWWTVVGDYRAMVERGNQRLVTDTYSWSDGRHVTEVDSINVSLRLFNGSSFHVGEGASTDQAAFGFTQHDTALADTPHAPPVTLCT